MRRPLMLLLFVTLSLSACEVSPRADSALDDELEAQLVAAAAGEGLSAFRMPLEQDLHAIPQDPRNPLTPAKVALGQLLFHETGLASVARHHAGDGVYSCASCHHAAAGFQAGRIQGIAEGGVGFGVKGEGRSFDPDYPVTDLDVQPIRSPSAMNTAWQELMLWNGQFGATGANAGTEARWSGPIAVNELGYEGLESQAIAALIVHRMESDAEDVLPNSIVATNAEYRALWQAAFGSQPVTRERAGLAIAAYERTLLATQSPFQRWLRGNRSAMDNLEKEGAILFFGSAGCVSCHNGPALASMSFHALGMAELSGADVRIKANAPVEPRGREAFSERSADQYAFKTPQLYNLIDSPFLGHGGSFRSVRDVIAYKNSAIPEVAVPAGALADEFVPLGLSPVEIDALTAFVSHSLRDPDLKRYVPERLPSGNCFPVNDSDARRDLGC